MCVAFHHLNRKRSRDWVQTDTSVGEQQIGPIHRYSPSMPFLHFSAFFPFFFLILSISHWPIWPNLLNLTCKQALCSIRFGIIFMLFGLIFSLFLFFHPLCSNGVTVECMRQMKRPMILRSVHTHTHRSVYIVIMECHGISTTPNTINIDCNTFDRSALGICKCPIHIDTIYQLQMFVCVSLCVLPH